MILFYCTISDASLLHSQQLTSSKQCLNLARIASFPLTFHVINTTALYLDGIGMQNYSQPKRGHVVSATTAYDRFILLSRLAFVSFLFK